ncbi:MAG TPA: hypothetical protein VFR15_01825 [Chloroflexia bacterium]|nr:hypothetical protein [Chloroflexia bacterium]
MPADFNGRHDDSDNLHGYDVLLDLEDLESLLEQLEEAGVVDEFDPSMLPPDVAELAREAGVSTLADLRALIEASHRQLDDGE